MPSMKLWAIAAVVVPAAVFAPSARADDTAPAQTDREKQLEKRVDDLEKQLSEVNRKLAESGASKSGDELDARVTELEKLTKKDKDGLFPYWGNGIRMDSADGAFKLKIGGRIQSDWSWFQHTSAAEDAFDTQIEAGEEFRRARLYVGGTMYRNVEFMAEYDFAGGSAAPRNVWIALKDLPFGTFTVGNMKEPTGTEELTDDCFIPFMERSTGDGAFAPSFKAGFMGSNTFCENEGSWQLGMFRDSALGTGNDTGNTSSGEYNFSGRVAGRPWKNDDATQWILVSAAASLRTPSNDQAQFQARPELHLAPNFVNTGTISANQEKMLVLDSTFVTGPLWVFGDYYVVNVDQMHAPNLNFSAWQLAAGFFLTGESKAYRASNSTFDRVKPLHNFDGKGGMGAWEIATRYDEVDLNDSDIDGGELKVYTLGVNWYLNPNTRVTLDWVHAMQKTLGVWINGLEMRFQVDF